jgi:hypothetical protein
MKKKTVEYEISLLYLAGIEISSRYLKESKKYKNCLGSDELSAKER